MERGYIGIDFGTTNLKTAVFSQTGELACLPAQQHTKTGPGWRRLLPGRGVWAD